MGGPIQRLFNAPHARLPHEQLFAGWRSCIRHSESLRHHRSARAQSRTRSCACRDAGQRERFADAGSWVRHGRQRSTHCRVSSDLYRCEFTPSAASDRLGWRSHLPRPCGSGSRLANKPRDSFQTLGVMEKAGARWKKGSTCEPPSVPLSPHIRSAGQYCAGRLGKRFGIAQLSSRQNASRRKLFNVQGSGRTEPFRYLNRTD